MMPVVNVDIVQTSDSEINPRYRGIYILQTLQITAREKGAFRRKCLKKSKNVHLDINDQIFQPISSVTLIKMSPLMEG